MAKADPRAPLLITRWARQSGRLPPALAPGHARFDERGFADIVAEAAHFARSVRFFGLDDKEAGTWNALLDSDGTVLLALIAGFDVGRHCQVVRTLLRRLRRDADPEQREAMLRRIIDELRRFVGEIDRWLGPVDRLDDAPDARAVAALIAQAVDEAMAPRLRELIQILAAAERAGRFDIRILILTGDFHHRWRIDLIDEAFSPLEWDPEGFWLDSMIEPIETAVDAFLHGAEAMVDGAAAALEASTDHPDHRPHVALLLAFARLFGHAQAQINALPGKIAGYYHERVIGASARGATMDRLYLAFTPAPLPGRPPVEISAGETFEAGGDEAGVPIRFAAESPLTVTGAKVTEIRSWRPETVAGSRRRVAVTRVAPVDDGALATALAGATAEAAEIGLILAGPELEAASGERILKLTFELSGLGGPEGLDAENFSALLKQAFRLSISTVEGWIDVTGTEAEGARAEPAAGGRARAVFGFSLSADDPPLVRSEASGMPDAPAIRLLLVQDPIRFGGTDGGSIEVAPLSLFATARIASLRFDIAVAGLGGLELSTSSGPVAAIGGIPAFGSLSAQRNWLRADHRALRAGTIDRLALTLAWADPPADPHGLYGHYLEYVVGPDRRRRQRNEPLFHNHVFQVLLEAPLAGGSASFRLFPTAAPAGPLPASSTFAVPAAGAEAGAAEAQGIAGGVKLTLIAPDYGFGESLYPINVAYAASAGAAEAERERRREKLSARLLAFLLKLLTAPLRLAKAAAGKLIEWDKGLTAWLRELGAWARGLLAGPAPEAIEADAEPPPRPWRTLVRKLAAWGKAPLQWTLRLIALIKRLPAIADKAAGGDDAPAGRRTLAPTPGLTPNPPWRPVLAEVRLDYAAHCEMGRGALSLFHVRALDGPVAAEWKTGAALLPALPATPCLDIRVSGWGPGRKLSLLVLLTGSAGATPPLRWLALDGEAWLEIESPALRDETNGLAATGLVTLDGPGRSAGDAWLRIALDSPDAELPEIAAVLPDALSARRVASKSEAAVAPVPAESIATSAIPGIVRVRQPLESFGGRAAESTAAFGARVAERLRHKQRAVLDWDLERIVLEAFPDIARVRALPGRGASGGAQAGSVLLAVVPGPGGESPPDPIRPRATAAMRSAIADHLGRHASPFARIAVVDPAYVAADVAAAVALAPGTKAAAVETAVRDFLSPWAETGPDLPDRAAAADLAGALVAFLRGLDGVEAVGDVAVTLGDPSGRGWIVPVAGEVRLRLVQPAVLGA
jgi:hypothetical protein